MTADIAPDIRRAIEHDCARLMVRFMTLFDAQDYDGVGALFTDDAHFVRASDTDAPLDGRAAIVAALHRRPRSRLTRHLCTNIEIDVHSADAASGRCMLLLYAGDLSEAPATNGYTAIAKQAVGEYWDEHVRTPAGWRIARRVGRILLHT